MNELEIEWAEGAVRLADVDDLEDGDFYAIMAAERRGWFDPKVGYIGVAYGQHVAKRIRQNHSSYLLMIGRLPPDHEWIVMSGRVVGGSHERVSERLVKEAENLLIFRNRPKFNTHGRKAYTGRPMMIENSGDYHPLRARSFCCEGHREWYNGGGRLPSRCG